MARDSLIGKLGSHEFDVAIGTYYDFFSYLCYFNTDFTHKMRYNPIYQQICVVWQWEDSDLVFYHVASPQFAEDGTVQHSSKYLNRTVSCLQVT